MVRVSKSREIYNAPNREKKSQKKRNAITQEVVSKRTGDSTSFMRYPGAETAFKVLLSVRFCAAMWSNISDCDETFNYWEPMHFLVFGKGLQTWEYSPEFALRSYTYLLFHAAPAYLYQKLFQPNPLMIFYFIRCSLALVSSFAEIYFYQAVCREFGVQVGRITFFFQVISAGLFASSTAFLPSTFVMYTATSAFAAWLHQKYAFAVFWTALGAFLGWPFAALLGLPIAFDMLFRKKLFMSFFKWSLISTVAILVPIIAIDSVHYGRFVCAPFNLVRYNVLGGNDGPNLYGTEPFSFYFINGFVNFNLIWVFALLCPLAILMTHLFIPLKEKMTLNLPHWLSLSPVYLWLVVFMIQPHKEERFLFPIYPLICLCGAITLDTFQKLFFRVLSKIKKIPSGVHYLDKTTNLMFATVFIIGLLNLSRVFALYTNYNASFDLMMDLNRHYIDQKPSEREVNFCVGKDWYRFPSSFFLPHSNWNVRFIKSEFDGALPAPFSSDPHATTLIHDHFNDQNRAVEKLYFDVEKCDFLLDLESHSPTKLEPNYANDKSKWKILKSYQFLNVEMSHRLFRAFYIPHFSDLHVKYKNFNLLETVKHTIKKTVKED